MTHEPDTKRVLALAAIIRQVDDIIDLHADALACAILTHPDSQWGPALPVPTDAEIEADFRAWFEAKHECEYFGGISLCDAIAWGKHLLQHSPQPAAPWPQLPREVPPEVLNLATFSACNQEYAAKLAWQCCRAEIDRQRIGQKLSVPEPTPWPELPHQPPHMQGDEMWKQGYIFGWHAARAELQRLREQAGVAPTPAPAFPEISDQLIRSLIGDILTESETATEAACMDRPYNPVPRIRARLTEILQLAAQDEAAGKPAINDRTQSPAKEEVAELVAALNADASFVESEAPHLCDISAEQMRRIAELLQQRNPVPVAVSERMPDLSPDACDFNENGLIWWFTSNLGWRLGSRNAIDCIPYPTHWLPFYALQSPGAEKSNA